MITLYSSSGQAIAYLDDDGKSIYLYDGTPVGWLSDESVYTYSGRYLGWLDSGWFYDRSGQPAFFTDDSSGGLARPARAAHGARSARPARSLSWSQISNKVTSLSTQLNKALKQGRAIARRLAWRSTTSYF